MRIGMVLLLSAVIILSAVPSAFAAGMVVTPNEAQPTLYDIDFSGCTLEEVLRDLYLSAKAPSFALIKDDARAPEGSTRSATFLASPEFAQAYKRAFAYIGDTPVFYPCNFDGLRFAVQAASAQLVTSLTKEQLQFHAANGGLPFKALSESQQEKALFIVRNNTYHAQFPEPELFSRLEKSYVIVALETSIQFTCDIVDPSGQVLKGGFVDCGQDVVADFWKRHAPGQIEAGKMMRLATTVPDASFPGGEKVHALNGVYPLVDLLQLIGQDTQGSVRASFDATKVRISAYCSMTGAALARACAIATGQAWTRKDNAWVLGGDFLKEDRELFGASSSSSDYLNMYYALWPELERLARSGALVLAADSPWNDKSLVPAMVDAAIIDWASLTPERKSHLEKNARMYTDIPGQLPIDLAGRLSNAVIYWSPNMHLYIATNDSILYAEGLTFRETPTGNSAASTGKGSDAH